MIESVRTPVKRPSKTASLPKQLQIPAVIRCSECGNDFKSDRAFQEHDCHQEAFNFDYAVGSNL